MGDVNEVNVIARKKLEAKIKAFVGDHTADESGELRVLGQLIVQPWRDRGGNVAIGTEPAETDRLTVAGNISLSNSGNLFFKAAGDDPGDIVFQNSEGTQKARIWSQPAPGAGLFLSSGDIAPDIAIDAAGKVGIGTTEPHAKLEVCGPAGGTEIDLIVNGRLSSIGPGGGLWVDSEKRFVGSNSGDGIGFFNGGAWQLTVRQDGNVGIGTPGPQAKLHVYDTAADVKIAVDASAEHEAGFVLSSGYNREWEIYRPRSSGDMRFWESGVGDRVTFQAGGNVGIGTTRPQARFHVMGDACIAENEAQDPIKMTGGAGHLLFWCHDLHIGHKERRGEPGRALVDLGDTLILNYGPDWANVRIDGKQTNFSSREVKENIVELTFDTAQEVIAGLNPVSFTYKHDQNHEANLGFIAEDVPAIVGATDHKSVNPLGIIAVLTRVVKEQQRMLADLSAQVCTLQAQQGC